MELLEKITPLLGRIALAAIFLMSGLRKLANFSGTAEYMSNKGSMILPEVFLVGAIILLLFGSISLLLGFKTRYGVVALITFLIPATLIFHSDFPGEMINFMKNVAILGGLLMVAANGPGNWSVDGPDALKNEE